ncbi:VCBS repeat-containing protein, partial [Candidatus Parcubacteria bacterium]|nr:VCBS repeat-containing protein [Candidatus Parcubacteria bacterium]
MKKLIFTFFPFFVLFLPVLVFAQSFTDISTSLTGVSNSSVAWGDYDNDGDLDILLAGVDNYGPVSKIYRNDAGTFVDINANIINVSESSVDWGDYDNDG